MYPKVEHITNESKIKEKVFCNTCRANTIHASYTYISITDVANEEYEDPTFWSQYHIIKCKGCNSISFMEKHNDSENVIGFGDDAKLGLPKIHYYPERMPVNKSIIESHNIPDTIQEVYTETMSLIGREMYRFAALGLRLIIEELVKEKGSEKWGLKDRINELYKNKTINEAEKDVLLLVKDYGDGAAHRDEIQPAEILELSIEVLESILIRLYVFEEQVKSLKEKVNK